MYRTLFVFVVTLILVSCSTKEMPHSYTAVEIETIFQDSVSIRAIEFLDGKTLAFAGSGGMFGTVDLPSGKVRANIQNYDTLTPSFRAVAHTRSDFFMLSAGNPALLYKTGNGGQMGLVYKEAGEGVFYDAMTFWNDFEGIAIGDTVDGCLSIIITRDGGESWEKLTCDKLPNGIAGEGAFAASNTNIAIVGDNTWAATTEGRLFFSPDKGYTWDVVQTPIINSKPTEGIYSLDFYNETIGFAIGGDYTQPEADTANKISTADGGQDWTLVANGKPPGYKSCVQFVPNSGGKELVAIGFTGVDYSQDGGHDWVSLNDESFYTLRFLNDSVAYAAGKNRIAKMIFR